MMLSRHGVKSLGLTSMWLIMLLYIGIGSIQAQTIRYVREGARGEGRSWSNASGSLQAMIDISQPGDVVYVAAGCYYAQDGRLAYDERMVQGQDGTVRQRSFVMKSGVKVYGGFDADPAIAGAETPETRKKIADARYGWELANVTTLTGSPPSGGLADNWYWNGTTGRWVPAGYVGDNTLHVVWFASEGFESLVEGEATPAKALSETAVLDGFTIRGGAADGIQIGGGIQGHSARFGGGVYLVGNGVLQNCVVRENYAITRGGGVFMNNGGTVSDCMVERNASPGSDLNRNGFGGGVYILVKGKVERSFIVNNSARIGAGLYGAKDSGLKSNEIIAEVSVIANNTAFHEAGGVYLDRAGVLTGVMIMKNLTQSTELRGYGNTGGLYCNEFGVMTGCVLWDNVASSTTRQYWGNNVYSSEEMNSGTASVQFVSCGIQNASLENFGKASVQDIQNLNAALASANPQFHMEPPKSGVIDKENYLSYADWDKDECSVLYKKGATVFEAPLADGARVTVPVKVIDGTLVEGRPDIGAYFISQVTIRPVMVGSKWVVFVDNQSGVCGDGSSWDRPLRLISPAIVHLASIGGGEVWVREGEYYPVVSDPGSDPKVFTLKMGNRVEVYGGFPRNIRPDKQDRNPVAYRTIINGDIGIRGDNRDNINHLVTFGTNITDGAVFDGFTLLNANASNDVTHGEGGAVLVLSPGAVIRNCMIENCKSVEGAAIWSNAPVSVENCVVNNNEVTGGVGAAVVKVEEGSELMNMTVVLNKGVGVALSSGRLINSVIWGNTGDDYFKKVQVSGLPDVRYSAIERQDYGKEKSNIVLPEAAEGNGAVNFLNPTLRAGIINVGYATSLGGRAIFEPSCLSVLVNTGTSVEAPTTDIACKSRLLGGQMDIGAYQSTCMPMTNTRYVRVGGTGDGSSWAKASGDLQKMVNSLSSGGQVWVAAGTYSGRFRMVEGVSVYGGFPAYGTPGLNERHPADMMSEYCTILDAGGSGRVLEQPGDFTTLTLWDGFTLQNGRVSINSGEDGGAGAILWKNGSLKNCRIIDNQNSVTSSWGTISIRGGGVHCRGGVLENCYISNNKAVGSTSYGGSSEVYGGGIYMTAGKVFNCVISGNSCSGSYADGCAAFVEQADFYNNTIVNNTGSGSVRTSAMRIGSFPTAQFAITNCIIYNNAGTMLVDDRGSSFKGATYSCIQGGYPGVGNISEDPKFRGANDFRLSANSPCINTGNTYINGVVLPLTDMDYTDRIKDCAIDMGAYEAGSSETVVPGNAGGKRTGFVTRDGAGKADGSSWDNAACESKLQKVIDKVAGLGGGEVWVGTGNVGTGKTAEFYPTYINDPLDIRNRSFIVRNGVRLLGGFTGVEKTEDERVAGNAITVLNGDINNTPSVLEDDVYHVVKVEGGGMLEGFTVIRGNANHSSDVESQRGGGVWVEPAGSVRNCFIEKCYALNNGGGVYLAGKEARLTGSVITGNQSAKEGGGVYGEAYSQMTGNTVVRNEAAKGGGISFAFPARIIGVVIWGNSASLGKDLWGNTETMYTITVSGGQQSIYPVSFSAIEGLKVSGRNNLSLSSRNFAGDLSPEFIDPDNGNWDIDPGSPLVDAGVNNEVVLGLPTAEDFYLTFGLSHRDMNGRARVNKAAELVSALRMDIGAYEVDHITLPKPKVCRLYVTRAARGTMDGSSWQNSMSDLQLALDYFKNNPCEDGKGEIWLQGGYAYTPSRVIDAPNPDMRGVAFILPDNVCIYGGFKGDAASGGGMLSEQTVDERVREDLNGNGIIEDFEFKYETLLDGEVGVGQNAYHVLYYVPERIDSEILLNGVTVRGGSTEGLSGEKSAGAGIYALGKINIQYCMFRDNKSVGAGSAIYAGSGATIFNCSLGANTALAEGAAIYMNGGEVVNVNVFNNAGGGIDAVNARIANVNVLQNGGYGIRMSGGRLVNSIVWQNAGGQIITSGGATVMFCGVEGGFSGDGNINLNSDNNGDNGPYFLKPTTTPSVAGYDWTANWRVRSLSVLVDAGKNAEYDKSWPRTVNRLLYNDGSIVLIERIQNEIIDIGSQEYYSAQLKENACRLYVRTWEDLTVDSDGSSWSRATADLQGAIEALERSNCTGTKELWVAEGVYMPRKYRKESTDPRFRSFVVEKGGIRIYGGFPDDGIGIEPDMSVRSPQHYPVVLTGEQTASYHVMDVDGSLLTVVDGITFKGGRTSDKTGDVFDAYGAALCVRGSNVVVSRCIFTQNNGGSYGGALYVHQDGVLVANSLFYDNTGVAVCMNAGNLWNSTVINSDGGIRAYTTNIKNTVVWGSDRSIVSWNPGKPVIANCALQGGYEGIGNITLAAENDAADGPHFVSPQAGVNQSFELGCGSPLIDAGGNIVLLEDGDLAMKQRIRGAAIDIGAYESLRGGIPEKPVYNGPTSTCSGNDLVLRVDEKVVNTEVYWALEGSDVDLKWNAGKVTVGEEVAPGDHVYRAVRVDTITRCQSEEAVVVVHKLGVAAPLLAGGDSICPGEGVELTYSAEEGELEVYDGERLLTIADYQIDGNKIRLAPSDSGKHIYRVRLKQQINGLGECKSRYSDSVGVYVRRVPKLTSSVDRLFVNSGELFIYVPAADMEGTTFSWEREDGSLSGRDTIREMLSSLTDTDIRYNYTLTAGGCSAVYPLAVGISSVKMNVNVTEDCSGQVTLDINLSLGSPRLYRIEYADGYGSQSVNSRENIVKITLSRSILASQTITVSAYSDKNGRTKITSTPVWLWGGVTAPSNVVASGSACFGDDVVLNVTANSNSFRVYDNGILLDASVYTVNGKQITIGAPESGRHVYGVSTYLPHGGDQGCESTARNVTVNVNKSTGVLVTEGETTVKSGVQTNILLKVNNVPAFCEWSVKSLGQHIQITGGELKGSTINMTMLNRGSEFEPVVFTVRYKATTGCDIIEDITVWVEPVEQQASLQLVSMPGKLCEGDSFEVVYELSKVATVTASGLPAGITMDVTGLKVVVRGQALTTFSYTLTPVGGIALNETLIVHPTPEFELGEMK